MSAVPKHDPEQPFDERRLALIRRMREINASIGTPAPGELDITAEELRARQAAEGVRAENNIGSTELMRLRYGDDWDQE